MVQQSALPADLRIFAHAQFDAEEYVRGVCRESSTGLQIREKLERLRALRVVANEGLLRGAQEQAGTYVAATNKIRATAHELNTIVRHLHEFEEGLADLDDALARSLGESTEPRPDFPTIHENSVADLNGKETVVESTTRRARSARPDNEARIRLEEESIRPGEALRKKPDEASPTDGEILHFERQGNARSSLRKEEPSRSKPAGTARKRPEETKREKEPISERRDSARSSVLDEETWPSMRAETRRKRPAETRRKREEEPILERRDSARSSGLDEEPRRSTPAEINRKRPEETRRKREEEPASERRDGATSSLFEEEPSRSMLGETLRKRRDEARRKREEVPAFRRRDEARPKAREEDAGRARRDEANRRQRQATSPSSLDSASRTRPDQATVMDRPEYKRRDFPRKPSPDVIGVRMAREDYLEPDLLERSNRVERSRDPEHSYRASHVRNGAVRDSAKGDADMVRRSVFEKEKRPTVEAKNDGVGAASTATTTNGSRYKEITPTKSIARVDEVDDDDDDDVRMDDAGSVDDVAPPTPVIVSERKSRGTKSSADRSTSASKSAPRDDFASIDRLLDEGRIGLAVSRWLRASRDLRKAKKNLEPEAIDKVSRSIESRREPLAKAAEKGRVDGDARRLFGFGKGLRDAARDDASTESQATTAEAKLLFSDFDTERELRARHAMLHALGRKGLLESRLARLRSGLESLQASEPGRYWDGLAFAINDAYELFKSSDQKKNLKVEASITSFGNDAVASLVHKLAADLFTEERKHKALSDSARLARLVKAGSKSFDAFATAHAWPDALRSRPLQINALAPALALHCKTHKPSAVKAALGGDSQLADAVLVLHAKLSDLDR